MPRAGLYDERIQISAPQTGQSETGAPSTSGWALIPNGQVWARVEPLGSSKVDERDALVAIGSYRVTVRGRGDLTTKMRLQWRGRFLYIVSIDGESTRSRETALTCTTERP